MKMLMRWLADWSFLYMLAWFLIITAPIWLPIKLAIKLNNWVKEEAKEALK